MEIINTKPIEKAKNSPNNPGVINSSTKKKENPDSLLLSIFNDNKKEAIIPEDEGIKAQELDNIASLRKKSLLVRRPIIPKPGPKPQPNPTFQKIQRLTELLKKYFKFLNKPRPQPIPYWRTQETNPRSADMPFRNPEYMFQELYKALSEYTGIEATPQRMEAVMKFFKAYGQGKASDTNGDGKNDFEDVLNIWKKGYFDAIAWSPEEGDEINWLPPSKPPSEDKPHKPKPIVILRPLAKNNSGTQNNMDNPINTL